MCRVESWDVDELLKALRGLSEPYTYYNTTDTLDSTLPMDNSPNYRYYKFREDGKPVEVIDLEEWSIES